LGNAELEILATVEPGETVSDIAARLGYSESYVSRAVTDLADLGLIYTERDGRYKRIRPSDARAVALYRDLTRQYSHIDFADLLTRTTLEVLYYFDGPCTVADLADASDNYRNTVNRVLIPLRDRGLVGVDDGVYRFNGSFDRLHEFARELAHHRHRKRLESVAPRGTIRWANYDEFLAQTTTEVDADGFHETGLPRFTDYGLQFLVTSHRYYFYSDERDPISPADLCCHTLLIDDDTRHRSYCLLLLRRADIDEATLWERAGKYGIEETADRLVRYLDTAGDIDDDRFPEWTEFQAMADDYGVTLP
jgi:DNA-binding transcriptional ArsR family regulator